MIECKKCNANSIVCDYCIHKNNKSNNQNQDNEKIIYYNNTQYDNETKKVCPKCKKVYIGYPATSREDNKTLICTECGMKEIQEPFEEILREYGIEVFEE